MKLNKMKQELEDELPDSIKQIRNFYFTQIEGDSE